MNVLPTTPTDDPTGVLIEAALYYAQAVYGLAVSEVTVTLATGQRATLPVVRPPRLPAAEVRALVADPAGGCRADIFATLREAGRRLTTNELLAALERAGRVWGLSTVKGWLARLVREGSLTSNHAASPPGYGLPEWDAEQADD
jgi:hypothetical protein